MARNRLIAIEQGSALDIVKGHVLEALNRAEAKFPDWPDDPIHAAAIVQEESGELGRAAVQAYYEGGTRAALVKEAEHTAAMALRFLLGINVYGYAAEEDQP